MGLSPDTPLADSWTWGRALRFADGPDEVHLQSIARMEIKRSLVSRGRVNPSMTPPMVDVSNPIDRDSVRWSSCEAVVQQRRVLHGRDPVRLGFFQKNVTAIC